MKNKYELEYKQIGLNIAYYRKMHGLTQLQQAETVEINRTHMSNIEATNMPTSISLETLFEIADTLEISVAVLLTFPKINRILPTPHTTKPLQYSY